jgi:hypothetical protein
VSGGAQHQCALSPCACPIDSPSHHPLTPLSTPPPPPPHTHTTFSPALRVPCSRVHRVRSDPSPACGACEWPAAPHASAQQASAVVQQHKGVCVCGGGGCEGCVCVCGEGRDRWAAAQQTSAVATAQALGGEGGQTDAQQLALLHATQIPLPPQNTPGGGPHTHPPTHPHPHPPRKGSLPVPPVLRILPHWQGLQAHSMHDSPGCFMLLMGSLSADSAVT